jgi:hypothetical protein
LRHYFANPEVIGYEEVTRCVYSNPQRELETSRHRRAAITAETARAIARNRGDDALRRHLANPTVAAIGYEEVARCVYGNCHWTIQLSRCSRATITTEAPKTRARRSTAARNRGYGALWRHFANPAVTLVRNEEITRCVYGNSHWSFQLSRCRRATITTEAPT